MDRKAKGFDIDNFHTFQDIQKHLLDLEGMMTPIYKKQYRGLIIFLNSVAKHPKVSTQIIGKSSEGRDLRRESVPKYFLCKFNQCFLNCFFP